MNQSERSVYRRPVFDPDGVLVARKELTFSGVTYAPGMTLPSRSELGIDARAIRKLWEQFQIDTHPQPEPDPKVKAKKK